MSLRYGEIKRAKPQMRVLRGYPGISASNLSAVAKPKSGVQFKSGQIVKKDGNGQWDLATKADKNVYIIQTDWDDTSSIAADGQHAFDFRGNYEFESGYYVAGAGIVDGTELTADAGSLTPAANGDAVVATATRSVNNSAIRDLAGQNSEATDSTVIAFVPVGQPYIKA